MTKGRMEAFTDGVVAIVITIMVLEMKVPAGTDLRALSASAPEFLAYALAYVNVGLFWNNHHHVLHASDHVDGRVLWANLLLLFWLTLIPFVVRWIDDSHIAPLPTAAYGVVLFMAAVGYWALERALIAVNGPNSKLARAVGAEWKGLGSMLAYLVAAPLAFVSSWISIAIYVAIALMWFIPDRRIETRLKA
ncbi:MAG TPA: TMEM175 family protein [Caulobacteraceae bacterium]